MSRMEMNEETRQKMWQKEAEEDADEDGGGKLQEEAVERTGDYQKAERKNKMLKWRQCI